MQWPCREGEAPQERLYADGKFPTANGRANLIRADWEPFPEQPTASYPLHSQYRPNRGALAYAHQDA